MDESIFFPDEPRSNEARRSIGRTQARGQRTYTPTQAVIAHSSGIFHYTPEGRRLADFSSGVLVANLGHNPPDWLERFFHYMQWDPGAAGVGANSPPLTTYNAIAAIEVEATDRLLASLQQAPGSDRLQTVLWAASGSEAVQKALWACLHHRPDRDVILATRHGFHGKKGLAGAVTGHEGSPDRDPRVRFISFPREECRDVSLRDQPFDPTPYRAELDALARQFPGRINSLVTEPYLGGGGSYHPHPAYLRMVVDFCHDHDVLFVLDEVQSNFGRTGSMYAFESYGIEPDIVVLGKGMGNGVPVNAAVGRADVLSSLAFGEGSDTWSGHPLGCAALLATLDVFAERDVIEHVRTIAPIVEQGLCRLKEIPIVAAVRGEGMVWGVELAESPPHSAGEVANACVRAAYLGDGAGNAIHLLGPLQGKVLRISPPLTMTAAEARFWLDVLHAIVARVAGELLGGKADRALARAGTGSA